MRNILLFWLLLSGLIAQAQTRTLPTNVTNPDYQIPFTERLRREAFGFNATMSPVNTSGTAINVFRGSTWNQVRSGYQIFTGIAYDVGAGGASSTANTIVRLTPNGNRVFYLPTVTISISSTASVTSFTVGVSTVFGGTTYAIPNGGFVVLNNVYVYPTDFYTLYMVPNASNTIDNTPVSVTVNMQGGYDFTDDDRPEIRGVQLEIGDSITAGTGNQKTQDTWLWQLNHYYDNREYRLRRVNMGEYARKSDWFALRFNAGFYNYNLHNLRLITYMVGTNNANIAGTIGEPALVSYYNDVLTFLNWRKLYCPKTVCFVLGPPPVSTTFNQVELNLVLVRQRQRLAVIAYQAANPADKLIRFIDFGGSTPEWPTPVFDKTVSANYSDGLHPKDGGVTAMAQRIINYIELPANRKVLVPFL